MRGYIVLLAVGIVAALIGVGVLAAGFSPQTHPLFFAISAGANRYVRYQFSVVTGGSVSGTFTADSGTVNVWVMTDAQHTAFIATGTLTYLSATSGASGAFSADLPSGGTYFVETGHGGGYESTVQTGTEDVTINALPTSPFVTSVVIIAVGAVLLGVGLWWRSRRYPAVAVARNSPCSWHRRGRRKPRCGSNETRFEPTAFVASFSPLRLGRCIRRGSGIFPYTISAVHLRSRNRIDVD